MNCLSFIVFILIVIAIVLLRCACKIKYGSSTDYSGGSVSVESIPNDNIMRQLKRTSTEWNMELVAHGFKPYYWYPPAGIKMEPPKPLEGVLATPYGDGIIYHTNKLNSEDILNAQNSKGLGHLLGYMYPMKDLAQHGLWCWWRINRVMIWGESIPNNFSGEKIETRIRELNKAIREIDPLARATAEIEIPTEFGNPYSA